MKLYISFLILLYYFLPISTQIVQGQEDKNINIKVEPSKYNKLTLDDLDQIKMEILHDMNSHIRNIEDDITDNQRLTDKTLTSWSQGGAPVFLPRNPNAPNYSIPIKRDIVPNGENERLIEYNCERGDCTEPRFKEIPENNLERILSETNKVLGEWKTIGNNEESLINEKLNEINKVIKREDPMKSNKNIDETINSPNNTVGNKIVKLKNINYNPFKPEGYLNNGDNKIPGPNINNRGDWNKADKTPHLLSNNISFNNTNKPQPHESLNTKNIKQPIENTKLINPDITMLEVSKSKKAENNWKSSLLNNSNITNQSQSKTKTYFNGKYYTQEEFEELLKHDGPLNLM